MTMKVHGLDGIRVVDASVMPYVTNGNIYAPVMMLAEKAADLILGNTPLPPDHAMVPARPLTIEPRSPLGLRRTDRIAEGAHSSQHRRPAILEAVDRLLQILAPAGTPANRRS